MHLPLLDFEAVKFRRLMVDFGFKHALLIGVIYLHRMLFLAYHVVSTLFLCPFPKHESLPRMIGV